MTQAQRESAARKRIRLRACAALFFMLGSASTATALDSRLLGAWAQSTSDCSAVFQRRGKAIIYRKPVDQFRSSFVIAGRAIASPSGDCRILSDTQKGDVITLKLSCNTSISYLDRTETIRLVDARKLSRGFTGEASLDLNYEKCPM